MPRRKTSKRKQQNDDEKRVESEWDDVNFDSLEPVTLELDPALREKIRSRDRLVSMTLRLGQDQLHAAKRVAAETNDKYQRVLRRWIAEGASRECSGKSKKIG
jgi:predicted DNA binding CopG/RHH family protein